MLRTYTGRASTPYSKESSIETTPENSRSERVPRGEVDSSDISGGTILPPVNSTNTSSSTSPNLLRSIIHASKDPFESSPPMVNTIDWLILIIHLDTTSPPG